ncbi:hypothetical protein LC608_34030 [Nostoc sp. XA010]|uniref:hypothetical protein n=1 Tax=Nostoc sp. XA010 TaxID=2780407 RepID=UPI001E494DF5|nr:hypothetical protein [Nostoc sp. XA010]MCC5661875.1 hypothetical protein [Nostoc sp. XA010]
MSGRLAIILGASIISAIALLAGGYAITLLAGRKPITYTPALSPDFLSQYSIARSHIFGIARMALS